MKLYNTATDTYIGDYPGDVPEALDAYARDVGYDSWARWCAEGRAPEGEDYEEELRRRQLDAARSDAHGFARRVYHVTTVIVARWAAAGYTTARLVDGLPRPERGYPGEWAGEGWARHCVTCARPWGRKGDAPVICPGPYPFDLVHDAVARGVPFGIVDGLPTAGEPIALDGILAKVAAATCSPEVRAHGRQAA